MVSPTPLSFSRLTRNYDLLGWIARLFVGAAFSVFTVEMFGDFLKEIVSFNPSTGVYMLSLRSNSQSYLFLFLASLALTSPLIASLVLTKRTPELKIVPPFYIEVLTIAWFIAFGLERWSPDPSFAILWIMTLVAAGFAEDRVVTRILGHSVDRNDIQMFKFLASKDIDSVKQVLSPPEIRATLGLGQRNAEIPHGFKLRSPRVATKQTVMKLEQFPNEEGTVISMAVYQVGRYQVRMTPELIHYSLMLRAYLADTFKRFGVELKDVEIANKYTEPLLSETFADIQGFYGQSKQMSVGDWMKIGFLIAIVIATIASFGLGAIPQASILAIVDALFAASELPELLRRGRR